MFKDSVITAKRKKRELIVALSCFAAAFLLNAYSVIRYSCSWTELFSQIGYMCVIAVILYAVVTVIRVIVALICSLMRKCRA